MIVTAWNTAIVGGGLIGGILFDTLGAASSHGVRSPADRHIGDRAISARTLLAGQRTAEAMLICRGFMKRREVEYWCRRSVTAADIASASRPSFV